MTNYYFETEKQDETHKDGWSKEHRRDPIIQMDLAIDACGCIIDTNHYLFDNADEVTDAMNAEFGTDITVKVRTVECIRKSIAVTMDISLKFFLNR